MSASVDDHISTGPGAALTVGSHSAQAGRDPHLDLHVDDLGALYSPPRCPVIVDVPPIRYLMVDGIADGATSLAWAEAVDALRDAERRAHPGAAVAALHAPAPLEVLHHPDGHHTLMIAVRLAGRARRGPEPSVRSERLHEGWAAQLLHVDSAEEQHGAWRRLERFVEARGYLPVGPRHEIVLDDDGCRRRVLRRAVRTAGND